MSREVPSGWELLRIGDLCKPASLSIQVSDDEDYDLLGVRWYGNGCHSHSRTKGSELKTRVLNRVRASQIVYNKMWVSKGAFAVVPRNLDGAHATAEYPSFDVRLDRLDPDFMEHYMRQEAFKEEAILLCKGSTSRARLNPSDFLDLTICLPPLHEQRRIAEILSSVDEAIAATRAIIEQTRKVKQGVLERLLTKGIGHTRFKQTEIGEIPEGWEVATLEELLADIPNPMRSGPFGSALKSEELVDSGVPFLGIDNIQVEQFIRNYKRFLSEDKFRQLRRFAVNPNDVVITIMGTVGRCCVVPPDIGEAVSSKHIWAMSLKRERYIAELACWQMNFAPWIVSNFTTSAQGGIMSAINSGILRKLVFPVPSLEEQRQIFQVWQSFQGELEVEQAKLQNLENLKSALMSDLLTGRQRVTDALPMAAE